MDMKEKKFGQLFLRNSYYLTIMKTFEIKLKLNCRQLGMLRNILSDFTTTPELVNINLQVVNQVVDHLGVDGVIEQLSQEEKNQIRGFPK